MRLLFSPSFNPCFNGTMYKNNKYTVDIFKGAQCFNPCFNGTMYKNIIAWKPNKPHEMFQSLF